MSNDLDFVRRVLGLLRAGDARCWIFGGWAEELHGLCAARAHVDLDLLCPAENFTAVEHVLAHRQLEEVAGKRFDHKRAFVLDEILVELFLVQRDGHGLFTKFFGRVRHDWPADLLSSASGFPVASQSALRGYRSQWSRLAPGDRAEGVHRLPASDGPRRAGSSTRTRPSMRDNT